MKRIVKVVMFAAALGALGGLAACGDSGTGGPANTSAVTPPPVSSPASLLTVADVGSSWQAGPEVNDADFTDAVQLPCADAAINPTIMARLRPTAGVQFEPVDGSSKHLIEFARTGEVERLAADLDILREPIDACQGRPPAGGEAGTVDVATLVLPALGDQRFGMVLTGTGAADGGVTWLVRTATVRVGAVAIDVRLTEILETPETEPEISDGAFVAIVERATARIPR